jgi:hypothetical protein
MPLPCLAFRSVKLAEDSQTAVQEIAAKENEELKWEV